MACAPQHWGPYNHTIREQGNDWPAVAHSMSGHVRPVNIRQVLERVLADRVPGDFAEISVWRGGACIYAKVFLAAHGVADRRVHVIGMFEPMRHQNREAADYLAASEEAVAILTSTACLTMASGSTRGAPRTSCPDFGPTGPSPSCASTPITMRATL